MAIPSIQNPSVVGCIEALERTQTIVEAISDELFCYKSTGHETIGSHLRHAVEHVQCLLAGIQKGQIDYDQRNRSVRLEKERSYLLDIVRELIGDLSSIKLPDGKVPIMLRELPSLNAEPISMETTIEREFVFTSSHIIHHLAVVYFICKLNDIELSNDLILAFSTSAHRRAIAG